MPKETVTTPSSPNRTASARSAYASRTFGRYAVGLRPILDTDASTRRAHQQPEKIKAQTHPSQPGAKRSP